MGEKFGIDANLIRLIWVAFTLGTMGFGALIYAGMGTADAGSAEHDRH
jgi:phage shock protein PspC (stress-responsive transcriptional regulator)